MSIFKCNCCTYFSDRKYNLQKHIDRKHYENIPNIQNYKNRQNVNPKVQNVNPKTQNVNPKIQNVNPIFKCEKCNKIYKTKKHLITHESKCNGIDDLTCSRCMTSFTTRQAKSRHSLANKCEARSIMYARIPNKNNLQNNIINNIDNSINKTINNIQINNYGSERLDHMTYDDIKKLLESGMNTIPLYIEKKHFNKNFPENNNIKYTEDNKCKVLEDNLWKEKDIGLLSTNLIKQNSEVLLLYCDENDIKLSEDINDADKYEHIKNKLIIIYNKSENTKYVHVLSKIKELIKNTKDNE
jgi:hypothetical protein